MKDTAITLVLMIAIARFEVPLSESAAFAIDAKSAYEALAACAGFIDGEFGQIQSRGGSNEVSVFIIRGGD